MTTALYAGMFDPVTNGHLDIATRAARLFNKVIIGVFDDGDDKRFLFTAEERVQMAKEAMKHLSNIEVQKFTGMVTDYGTAIGAQALIRGLRMPSDFELEFERALMNKKLHPEIETVCMMTHLEYQFVTAKMLKEVAKLGGNIDNVVPANVAKALKKKLLV